MVESVCSVIATFLAVSTVISPPSISICSADVTTPCALTSILAYAVPFPAAFLLPYVPAVTPEFLKDPSKTTFAVPSKETVEENTSPAAVPPSILKSRAFNNFVAVSALPFKAPYNSCAVTIPTAIFPVFVELTGLSNLSVAIPRAFTDGL